jgi:cytochrome b
VSAFVIAYLTEDDFLNVHTLAGYLILGLISARFIWGFIGTRYARFSDFVYSPSAIKQFLKDTLRFKAKRYIGHNPAGGAMVMLLIISLFITTCSGVLLLGAEESAGPLAHWFINASGFWGDLLEGLHEFFANFTVLLVFIHVAGVVVESLLHKENLISAMISGFKKAEPDNDKE